MNIIIALVAVLGVVQADYPFPAPIIPAAVYGVPNQGYLRQPETIETQYAYTIPEAPAQPIVTYTAPAQEYGTPKVVPEQHYEVPVVVPAVPEQEYGVPVAPHSVYGVPVAAPVAPVEFAYSYSIPDVPSVPAQVYGTPAEEYGVPKVGVSEVLQQNNGVLKEKVPENDDLRSLLRILPLFQEEQNSVPAVPEQQYGVPVAPHSVYGVPVVAPAAPVEFSYTYSIPDVPVPAQVYGTPVQEYGVPKVVVPEQEYGVPKVVPAVPEQQYEVVPAVLEHEYEVVPAVLEHEYEVVQAVPEQKYVAPVAPHSVYGLPVVAPASPVEFSYGYSIPDVPVPAQVYGTPVQEYGVPKVVVPEQEYGAPKVVQAVPEQQYEVVPAVQKHNYEVVQAVPEQKYIAPVVPQTVYGVPVVAPAAPVEFSYGYSIPDVPVPAQVYGTPVQEYGVPKVVPAVPENVPVQEYGVPVEVKHVEPVGFEYNNDIPQGRTPGVYSPPAPELPKLIIPHYVYGVPH